MYGGDGRYHRVPVEWYEYLPVTGTGTIRMKEDDHKEDSSVSHKQRLDRISQVLNASGMNVYRRHIASKV